MKERKERGVNGEGRGRKEDGEAGSEGKVNPHLSKNSGYSLGSSSVIIRRTPTETIHSEMVNTFNY